MMTEEQVAAIICGYEKQIEKLSRINDELLTSNLELSKYIREMERMQKWNRLSTLNQAKK